MIIINLTGGLGNQMYQYAIGRYISINNKTKLKYHFTSALLNTKRDFELDVFNIKATKATSEDLKRMGTAQNRYVNRILYLLDERMSIRFNPRIVTQRFPLSFDIKLRNTPDNSYVQGYFADEKYFEGIEDVLLDDFTLKIPLVQVNLRLIEKMREVNSVSLHVRRGDYLTNKTNIPQFIGTQYYLDSIQQIQKKVVNPYYFVFSDDISWCKVQFKNLENVTFVDHNTAKSSYKDLILMSKCRHNIVANSTFSWWGAWLNKNKEKIRIFPK